MRFKYFVSSVAFFACAQSAAADPLEPSAKWVLDYGQTQCTAARDYKTLGNLFTLALRPSPLGEIYELMIARMGEGPRFAEQNPATIDFGGGKLSTFMLSYGVDKPARKRFDIYHLSAAQMASAKDASLITFDSKHAPPIAFKVTSMAALLDSLAACTADLRQYWNYGGEKSGLIAKPAKVYFRDVFRDDDFPNEALVRGQSGSGRFLLLVDENNRIANCTVIESSGIPVFDVKSCSVIVERAKAVSARDQNGKPIRSIVRSPPITYKLQ